MIAALLLALGPLAGPGVRASSAQAPVAQAAGPTAAQLDALRRAALRRDPRALPRAPREHWPELLRWTAERERWPEGFGAAARALAEHDPARAVHELCALLERVPDFPPALHQLGVVYFRLQRYGDAAVPLERFLELAPERVAETRALAHAYYTLGRYAEARDHYQRVLAAEPRTAEAMRGLALSHLRLGDNARAQELLQQLLQLEPEHADAHAWLAQLLYDEEQLEAALAEALRARDLAPAVPRAWFLLGRIQGELGQHDAARAARERYETLAAAAQEVRGLEARLVFEPRSAPLVRRLIEVHAASGDIPALRAALARASALEPGSFELACLALGALERAGDLEGAARAAALLEERFAERAETWRLLEGWFARRKDLQRQLQAGERYRRLSAPR